MLTTYSAHGVDDAANHKKTKTAIDPRQLNRLCCVLPLGAKPSKTSPVWINIQREFVFTVYVCAYGVRVCVFGVCTNTESRNNLSIYFWRKSRELGLRRLGHCVAPGETQRYHFSYEVRPSFPAQWLVNNKSLYIPLCCDMQSIN